MSAQKDNSTLWHKVALRRRALAACAPDVRILQTHAGYGRLTERCYAGHSGVAIEKQYGKACHFATAFPAWAVYQADCDQALAAGLAAGEACGFVDIDPYGSPFPTLRALCDAPRAFDDPWQLVVNDGMRQKVRLGGAWSVKDLAGAVARWGNDLFPIYLDAARYVLAEIVSARGWRVAHFTGYYTGRAGQMTHYWATLTRRPAADQ